MFPLHATRETPIAPHHDRPEQRPKAGVCMGGARWERATSAMVVKLEANLKKEALRSNSGGHIRVSTITHAFSNT
jgi:hypothetical protein